MRKDQPLDASGKIPLLFLIYSDKILLEFWDIFYTAKLLNMVNYLGGLVVNVATTKVMVVNTFIPNENQKTPIL